MNQKTPPPDKQRKRRIASDEAHAWARNLRLKNSLAKLVLCMLTGYVDGDGVCFVGIEALGEDTELSADTVRKRLAWLENVGAIARFPQWIDSNGRRNGDGKGRRTSDEIRLLLNADPDGIEARADGGEVEETDADPRSVTPVPQRGLNAGDGGVGPALPPPLAPERPSDSSEGLSTNLNTEPEPEDSPPSVPQRSTDGAGGEDSNDQVEEGSEPNGDDLAGWTEFKREYEADGDVIVKSSLPMTLFRALNPEQRALLTKAARGLIYQRRKTKTTRPKPAPQTFIRETDSWDNWAGQAPPRAQDFHIIAIEGREANAYRNLIRMARGVAPIEAAGKYTLPRPLTPAEMAFAEQPLPRTWGFISDERQIASWLGFLSSPLTGSARRPLVEAHIVDNTAKRGFFAPWPWPPAKDGKVIPWPPPQAQTSTAA